MPACTSAPSAASSHSYRPPKSRRASGLVARGLGIGTCRAQQVNRPEKFLSVDRGLLTAIAGFSKCVCPDQQHPGTCQKCKSLDSSLDLPSRKLWGGGGRPTVQILTGPSSDSGVHTSFRSTGPSHGRSSARECSERAWVGLGMPVFFLSHGKIAGLTPVFRSSPH